MRVESRVLRALRSRDKLVRSLAQGSRAEAQLVRFYGAPVAALPALARYELLSPELQTLSGTKDRFKMMASAGGELLDLEINSFLGTQQIRLSLGVLSSFAAHHRLDALVLCRRHALLDHEARLAFAVDSMRATVATCHFEVGVEHTREMIESRLLRGGAGLVALYTESLQ